MRQSGHWPADRPLNESAFRELIDKAIASLDVGQARKEVEPFVKNPAVLEIWSRAFFQDICSRIQMI